MHDISNEKLLTLRQASDRMPGKPSIETLWRYRQGRGSGGHRLETVRVGRRVYVTETALKRFLRLITSDATPTPGRTAKHRQDAAELAKLGI